MDMEVVVVNVPSCSDNAVLDFRAFGCCKYLHIFLLSTSYRDRARVVRDVAKYTITVYDKNTSSDAI